VNRFFHKTAQDAVGFVAHVPRLGRVDKSWAKCVG
jgi:hypothetical protein